MYVLFVRGKNMVCVVCAGHICGMCYLREAGLWYVLFACGKTELCAACAGQDWYALYTRGEHTTAGAIIVPRFYQVPSSRTGTLYLTSNSL